MPTFEYSQLISAFIIGLLGGTHCMVMCGGIVSAISFQQQGVAPSFLRLLFYNLGRISSYTIVGAIFGIAGYGLTHATDIKHIQLGLTIFSSLLLILMALYIAGWLNWLVKIELMGRFLWQRIEPLGRKWIPIQKNSHAFIVGTIWGWLPCGLVYSVLIWALSAGSAVNGALLMLAFGLGTLPNLLAMGLFANKLSAIIHKKWLRQVAGFIILLFALKQLIMAVKFIYSG